MDYEKGAMHCKWLSGYGEQIVLYKVKILFYLYDRNYKSNQTRARVTH